MKFTDIDYSDHNNSKNYPEHVAIIMDGNGRWAQQKGLPRKTGHLQGVEAARKAVYAAQDLGIKYLTLFAFSSENWERPISEIRYLFALLRKFINSDITKLHANNVRVKIIGDRKALKSDLSELIDKSEKTTENNKGMTLVVAFNYGSRAEIIKAVQDLIVLSNSKNIDSATIDEKIFSSHLFTNNIPDPDLIIRTSGEQRLSNFLLWQAAYSELLFIDTLWPDFDRNIFISALDQYSSRERRYGGLEDKAF